ncbi:Cleavage stimulation factor subunit 3 [Thelohanellus kitauei]|uniref:Cleavage stimulation factor subunit 3 n=1 Tax=Thelohanellus kitauei TaxID=669202 RepID=A0A0C2M8T3_THEKT|nr:Cleavage stimulation factor subunit 3 [Thelohanellus kitauei]
MRFCIDFPSFVPGGVFPPPPKVTEFVNRLPPPECFTGPFVDVDKLMHSISKNVTNETIHNYKYEEYLNDFPDQDEQITDKKMIDDVYRYRQQKNYLGIKT